MAVTGSVPPLRREAAANRELVAERGLGVTRNDIAHRAQPQGLVRADLDQTDLVFTKLGLSAIIDASRAIAPDLLRRYLAVSLDGIRADRSPFTPLPTAHQTHTAMTRGRRGETRPEQSPTRSTS